MAKISVVISAYNEEKKIASCLQSVKDVASEIIVVDSSSLDNTVLIAKKYTEHVYNRPNNSMLNTNKNFGFTKATGDFILSLDADERVTPELVKEIKEKLQEEKTNVSGYWIPRKNIIFGKWIEHTGWYPDYQLRLFKKNKGRFPEKHVHEMVKIDGETQYLTENLIHEHYESIAQFLYKLAAIYVPNEAEQRIASGYTFKWQDIFRVPMGEFLSRFFAREGYKDGTHGLMLSALMAFYHLCVVATVWEKEKYRDDTGKNILDDVVVEFEKSKRDVAYWVASQKIQATKNPVKKILYRIKRKQSTYE